MNTAAATLPGFTVTPNGFDVRIECDTCHASKAGSLARAWAESHTHAPAPTDDELIAAIGRGVELGLYTVVDDDYLARLAADIDA